MNNFWPRRSAPEGFSIEKLAKSSRAKLAEASEKTFIRPKRNEPYPNFNKQVNINTKSKFIVSSNHWANRGFEEYHDAA